MSASGNFLGLDPTPSSQAKVAVISAPLETTTSFQHGTASGPEAFLRASAQVELYDIESGMEFHEVGAVTYDAPVLKGLKNEESLERIASDVRRAIQEGLWPITVGGEHTISIAPIRELKKIHPRLSVLQIDAHADLRDSYEGTPWSHACAMARVWELGVPVVGVGIRNYCRQEAEWIQKHDAKIFHAHEIHRNGLHPQEIARHLTSDVYITIDIDGFDPSECPGTGTPEPGGIFWHQALDLFKHVFREHNVVGMDVNEIMPTTASARTEFFAAKLAYRMMGMKFFPEKACR